MKKYGFLILFISILASCGGSAPKDAAIALKVDWPPAMSAINKSLVKLYGTLVNGEEIIAESLTGIENEEQYLFSIKDVGRGEYLFRLKFVYAADSGEVDIGSAEKKLELEDGGQALAITEADFVNLGGGDPDDDLLDNLTELVSGLDPFLSDTDGDGISDGLDIFPSVAAEWLDTDGDGIGDNSDDDIDGDGLANDTELQLGTNVYKADSDDDGISDADDNCRLGVNSDQKDIDGDGVGDVCDGDSDGDGLSNDEEMALGTDPLLTDTDGDGLSDKFETDGGLNPLLRDSDGDGVDDKRDIFPLDADEWQDKDSDGVGDNSDNCPEVPNSEQINTDYRLFNENGNAAADADELGDACDDDIDGDGLNFVYVDAARGSDDNLGVFAEPVKTIQRGILIAYQRGEDGVLVAGGKYDLKDAAFKMGIDLFGGYDGATFSNHSNARDIRSDSGIYRTDLVNSAGSITLYLNQSVGQITVEGFHIKNSTTAGDSTTVKLENSGVRLTGNTIFGNEGADFVKGIHVLGGSPVINANWVERGGKDDGSEDGVGSKGILVESGTPTIKNNIIRAGRAKHTVALEILNSQAAIVVNNTLDGTSYAKVPGVAKGFIFGKSDSGFADNIVVVNNIIAAVPGGEANLNTDAMVCSGFSPQSGLFKNNIFSTFTSQAAGQKTSNALVVDCGAQLYYSAAFTIGDATIEDNIAYSNSFSTLWDDEYRLNGDAGRDGGTDAGFSAYGNVTKDYDSEERSPGNYDIGAREK